MVHISRIDTFYTISGLRQQGISGQVSEVPDHLQTNDCHWNEQITSLDGLKCLDRVEDGGSSIMFEHAPQSATWVGQIPWLCCIHDFPSHVVGNRLDVNAESDQCANSG